MSWFEVAISTPAVCFHAILTRKSNSDDDDIFLKVSATRPDVMKVMIRGVRDSPYEGGLFV